MITYVDYGGNSIEYNEDGVPIVPLHWIYPRLNSWCGKTWRKNTLLAIL